MQGQGQQERIAWRLGEIARSTGVSLAFLRKQQREGKLNVRRLGSAVVVLDTDLREWLKGMPIEQAATVRR